MPTEEIRRLLAVARDPRKTKHARYDALDLADEMRRRAKLGWSRIEAGFDPAVVRCEIKAYRRDHSQPRPPKDGVCRLIKELLTRTEATYPEIVAAAHERFPNSQTTTKSVASLARDLKKQGVPVASRKTKKRRDQPKGGDVEPDDNVAYAAA